MPDTGNIGCGGWWNTIHRLVVERINACDCADPKLGENRASDGSEFLEGCHHHFGKIMALSTLIVIPAAIFLVISSDQLVHDLATRVVR